ncbi:hypothetical protein AVEN_179285-1 [Araneus ventricosus]|uniref:Uncharacterized protein n=1 Tax=Araneus ventricosus TaxID=182803 RepID=A0A4Y2S3S3_ARAVE|nr:hypothetical protein AVEN_134306-1 [Araneus ventricosus]GBN82838.1 hypothetical protein AVEN_179285-1 [Araneus ventricosus]
MVFVISAIQQECVKDASFRMSSLTRHKSAMELLANNSCGKTEQLRTISIERTALQSIYSYVFFRKRTNELTAVFTTEHCACHLLSDRTDAAGGAGQLCDGHARHPADACRIGSGKREECVCHRLFHRSHYGQGRTGCQRQIEPGR